ncbi:MAG: LytTR family DNA-binding domain-containing protein [Oscillospiraceae bacterium]|jgi:DNA-binding LytR/AlgR family response regulator|nr:LytTR family DNA-binding domain-containing protein [Oscillospiraceae bacterium]
MKIAICDDDVLFTDELCLYIKKKNLQMQEYDLQVYVYHSGEDFLKAVESGMVFQIVFMDIEMGAMNGITVGHQFRKSSNCDDVVIIYISSHNTYSEDLLDVGNVRYIKKPFSEDKLNNAFDRGVAQAIKYMAKVPFKFIYTVNKDKIMIDSNEIVYFKSAGKFIEIYKIDSTDRNIHFFDKFYSNIPEIIKRLPKEYFYQCERSHVVNLEYVYQIRSTSFVLTDNKNTQIPIGKTFRQEAKKAFFHNRVKDYVWNS